MALPLRPYGEHYINANKEGFFVLPNSLFDYYECDTVYLTMGMNQNLVIYPPEIWEKYINKFVSLPMIKQGALKPLFSNAKELHRDEHIDSTLAEFARLNEKAVIIGLPQSIEITNLEIYETYKDRIISDLFQEIQSLSYSGEIDAVDSLRNAKHLIEKKTYAKAFICHSSKDKPFVKRLQKSLLEAGVKPWVDMMEILPGDSIINKIQHGIDNCECFLIILSPDSVSSSWCINELNMALTNEINAEKVRVVPIKYRECTLPGFLRDKHYIDMVRAKTQGKKYMEGIEKLLNVLKVSYEEHKEKEIKKMLKTLE